MAAFIAIAAAACALLCGLILGSSLAQLAGTGMNRERALRSAGSDSSWPARIMRSGVPVLVPLARHLLEIGAVRRWASEVTLAARFSGYEGNAASIVSLAIAIAGVLFFLGAFLSGSPVFGLMAAACAIVAIRARAEKAIDARDRAIRDSLPDALQMMRGCFNVGYSLPQTISYLAKELEDPLCGVFMEAKAVLDTGGNVADALKELKAASHEEELAFIATALEIQHQTGSGIQEVLDSAQKTLKEELALKRSMQTQTAQAKLSATMVTLIPFVLVGAFSAMSPGFLDPFFQSFAGFAMLAVAVAMQFSGIGAVRRILRFEEGHP